MKALQATPAAQTLQFVVRRRPVRVGFIATPSGFQPTQARTPDHHLILTGHTSAETAARAILEHLAQCYVWSLPPHRWPAMASLIDVYGEQRASRILDHFWKQFDGQGGLHRLQNILVASKGGRS